MKTTKRFLLTLAAMIGMTGAWAQATDEEVAVTKSANNQWTLTMPEGDVELEVEYYATTPFDLSVGESLHGTVSFTVGGETVTQACYDDVVTVTVTPSAGYSAKDVTVRAYTTWAAGARALNAPALLDEISVTAGETEGTWTFTMPEANVWVVVTYTKNVQDAWIEAIADQTYTGEAIEPAVTVKDGDATLTLGTDYTVAYTNNTAAGTATVTVTGTGNYSGEAKATFTIQKANITMTTAPAAVEGLVYSGEPQTLITAGVASFGTVLYSTDGTNFSEALPQATEAGTYTVTYKVEGDDNHNAFAAQTLNVTIVLQTLATLTIAPQSYTTYMADKGLFLDAATASGVKLYTVTSVNGKQVVLAELAEAAAETPLIIYNGTDTEQSVVLNMKETATTAVTVASEFKGTLEAKTFSTADMQAADHYVLTGKNFVWVKDAGTLAAGKCWIQLTKSAGARRLGIVIGGDATGIAGVSGRAADHDGWYDLNGRRLAGKPGVKGLYVVDGKKVVVK